jgi:hypothetical protein
MQSTFIEKFNIDEKGETCSTVQQLQKRVKHITVQIQTPSSTGSNNYANYRFTKVVLMLFEKRLKQLLYNQLTREVTFENKLAMHTISILHQKV